MANDNTERKQTGGRETRFDIKTTDDAWAFTWLFDVARNHYVAARVSLLGGLLQSGCLLAHQCIEAYLKAIARATNQSGRQVYYFSDEDDPTQVGKTQIWGHKLSKLMTKMLPNEPVLGEILNDSDLKYFVRKLTKAYEAMRFGEATFTLNPRFVCQWLDKVVSVLDKLYHEKRGVGKDTKIFVPPAFRCDFLKENHVFTADRITDWPFDSHRIGMEMPSSLEELYWKARKEAESKAKTQA